MRSWTIFHGSLIYACGGIAVLMATREMWIGVLAMALTALGSLLALIARASQYERPQVGHGH